VLGTVRDVPGARDSRDFDDDGTIYPGTLFVGVPGQLETCELQSITGFLSPQGSDQYISPNDDVHHQYNSLKEGANDKYTSLEKEVREGFERVTMACVTV
jgi:hypothetical protein